MDTVLDCTGVRVAATATALIKALLEEKTWFLGEMFNDTA